MFFPLIKFISMHYLIWILQTSCSHGGCYYPYISSKYTVSKRITFSRVNSEFRVHHAGFLTLAPGLIPHSQQHLSFQACFRSSTLKVRSSSLMNVLCLRNDRSEGWKIPGHLSCWQGGALVCWQAVIGFSGFSALVRWHPRWWWDSIQGDASMFLLSWLRPWEEVKKLEEDLLFEEETFLKNLASNFVLLSFQEINRLYRSLWNWAGSHYWLFSLSIKNTTVWNLLQIKTSTMFVSALLKETHLPFQLELINHTWEYCYSWSWSACLCERPSRTFCS